METNPNYVNLFGSIESSISRMGVLQTDFTKIKAGSLLQANGGYLVINALDALSEIGIWQTLKRTLRNQTLEIQNPTSLYMVSTGRLKPEPIKINVKVVMIGDAHLYNLLYFQDNDFKKIFKIKAEFDSETARSPETIKEYASFIKKICDKDNLNPFNQSGMAAVIEYGMRLSGQQKKLSTRFHILADVIREACYWARKGKEKAITRAHVETAIRERFERVSLIEDKIQEMIVDGTIMIDTEGQVVGQVNGLSVYMLGETAFGKPTRITTSTSVGRAGVINIEREAELFQQVRDVFIGIVRNKRRLDSLLRHECNQIGGSRSYPCSHCGFAFYFPQFGPLFFTCLAFEIVLADSDGDHLHVSPVGQRAGRLLAGDAVDRRVNRRSYERVNVADLLAGGYFVS